MAIAPGILIHEVYSEAQKSELLINSSDDSVVHSGETTLEEPRVRELFHSNQSQSPPSHTKENLQVEEKYTKALCGPVSLSLTLLAVSYLW